MKKVSQEKGVLPYLRFLREHKKPGDVLYSGPDKIDVPSSFHKPTVAVFMSLMAGAGILKKGERGSYECTNDLFDTDLDTLIDLYRTWAYRKRGPGDIKRRKSTGAVSSIPEEPQVEEIEIDVLDALREIGLDASLDAIKVLASEAGEQRTHDGRSLTAEIDRLTAEMLRLGNEIKGYQATIGKVREELKEEREKNLTLRTELNQTKALITRTPEKTVFIPVRGLSQKDSGGTGPARPSSVIVHKRPLTTHTPGGIKRGLTRKR